MERMAQFEQELVISGYFNVAEELIPRLHARRASRRFGVSSSPPGWHEPTHRRRWGANPCGLIRKRFISRSHA